MTKNITLSADDSLIRRARQRAMAEHKSLNDAFREWIGRYAGVDGRVAEYRKLMAKLSHVRYRGPMTRDELNERR